MQTTTAWRLVLPPALFALALSCGHDRVTTSGAGGDTLAAQMTQIELDADADLEDVIDEQLSMPLPATTGAVPAVTVSDDRTFDRIRSCPAGGEVRWQGSVHRTWDSATRTLEATFAGRRTMTDCAFVRNELTITVDGASQWDAFRRRVDGRADGLQTTHASGSWAASRSDGEQRTCSFDLTFVRDPATHTRTLDGTTCHGSIHRVVTWTGGS